MREKWKHYRAGDRIGRWLLVEKVGARANGSSVWHCRCDCGTERDVSTEHFTKGVSASCGCLRKERAAQANRSNLVGQKFGCLTVIEAVGTARSRNRIWRVVCDCGIEKHVETRALTTGHTVSCGCAHQGSVPMRNERERAINRAKEARRRARKTGAGGAFTESQIEALYVQQHGCCAACREPLPLAAMHRDHIVPIAHGGCSDINNIQLLCPTCNRSKGAKRPEQWSPRRSSFSLKGKPS